MPDADKSNILIVDDLPEKLLVYRTILEDLGQNLVAVSSGSEALKEVLRQDFAVILMDVNMPGMDGFETAGLIRQRKRSAFTPIIFITAFADEVHTARGYAHGAVDFIPSPVVPDVLRSKVRVFVDLFRMTLQVKRQAEEHLALMEEKAKRTAAEETNRRLRFLARAGSVLGRSLDFNATLHDLVHLAVPFLADECVVALADGAGEGRKSVLRARIAANSRVLVEEQAGPEHLPEELAEPVQRALTAGISSSTLAEEVSTSESAATTIIRPLQARGQTLAVLALILNSSGRQYSPADVAVADSLASRAAIALENARLHQSLQEADRRKDDFLAMLAHELRNPLGPVRNAVQVLRLVGPQDQRLTQARDMIDRQVTHMARLVDDLLDATRIARGKILLRKEQCELARIVRQTAEDYRSVFEASGLSMELSLPTEPLWVEGDPTRLAQMVGNLLHNAHKFTNPGGKVVITVGSDRRTGQVCIRVADTGIGIEPTMLPRILEVFAQADRSLDRSRGGLGLGLALVKGLAELHGGTISAESNGLGHGAMFTISLPMVKQPQIATQFTADEVPGKGCRVLVIEDNRDAADSTRLLLTLAGHEVQTAYDGKEGIEMARRFLPHVILCDIGLPGGMNGYDVARQFRQDQGGAPVFIIAMTGYGRDEDQRQAKEAGFDLHLTKPVDYNHLRRILAGLSSRSH